MGTRAKIKVKVNGHYLCVQYFHMDGHVGNWASGLITALKQTDSAILLKSKPLLTFMLDDDESDEYLDYRCEVDFTNNHCTIMIYDYKKNVIFAGTLDEFSEKYAVNQDED